MVNRMNTLHLTDCMEYMSQCDDNAFDLAIVDPPYGIDVNMNMGRRKGMGVKHSFKEWDNNIPDLSYFEELFRISKNQIIWGGNYFDLKPTRCFIIWDKKTPEDLSFAMCEFAWTSFDLVAKIFRLEIQKGKNDRIHPTQKNVALYKWLLQNYAKPGDKLLDTHSGSGSFRIAAHDLGFDLVSCELDPDYCQDNEARFQRHIQQIDLFKPEEIQEKIFTEGKLF